MLNFSRDIIPGSLASVPNCDSLVRREEDKANPMSLATAMVEHLSDQLTKSLTYQEHISESLHPILRPR